MGATPNPERRKEYSSPKSLYDLAALSRRMGRAPSP
jgi:hypothetical protein